MPVAPFSGLDTLAGIFAYPGLPRLMRFFLFNPHTTLTSREISERTRLPSEALRKGIKILLKTGMVRRVGTRRFTLDQSFPHINNFRMLLFHPETLDRKEILKRLKSVGTFHLVAIGGLLAGGDNDEAVDILLVGDRVNDRKLVATLRALEAETGKELTYALLTTREFHYRLGMHDKLIRLVLEGPHQNLVNRLGV